MGAILFIYFFLKPIMVLYSITFFSLWNVGGILNPIYNLRIGRIDLSLLDLISIMAVIIFLIKFLPAKRKIFNNRINRAWLYFIIFSIPGLLVGLFNGNFSAGARAYAMVFFSIFLIYPQYFIINKKEAEKLFKFIIISILFNVITRYLNLDTLGNSSNASMLALWLFFYAFLYRYLRKTTKSTIFLILMFIIVFPIIFFAGKRNNILQVVIGTIPILLYGFNFKKRIKNTIIMAILIPFIFLLFKNVEVEKNFTVLERYQSGVDEYENFQRGEVSGNVGWRMYTFIETLDLMLDKPIFGNGFAAKNPNGDVYIMSVHNSFLAIGASAGIIDLVFLMILLYNGFKFFIKNIKKSNFYKRKVIAIYFLSALLIFIVNSNFQPVFITYGGIFGWMMMGLGITILSYKDEQIKYSKII
jgi:O-antigen ligase